MSESPETFLRGIRKEDHKTHKMKVKADAFMPDDRKKLPGRADGYLESSINWEDDNQAKSRILKDFQHGYVRVETTVLMDILKLPNFPENFFSYERDPLQNNIYHGNLLFSNNLDKDEQKSICSLIALNSSLVLTS